MTPIILSTIITCSQAINIINRLTSVVGLTPKQKTDIVIELKSFIPNCPITIKQDGSKKK